MKRKIYLSLLMLGGALMSHGQGSQIYSTTQTFAGGYYGVYGQLTFNTGFVVTPRATPTTSSAYFTTGSTYTGASNASHVNGYAEKEGITAFTFPVGNGTKIRTAGISAPASSAKFQAAYWFANPNSATLPSGAPFPVANLGTGVSAVSNLEYWDINGALPVNITLSWDAASALGTLTSNTIADLVIAGYNTATSKWENLGAAGGTTGTLATTGTITATGVTPNSYVAYTFAKAASIAGVQLSAKIFLEGSYTSGATMRNDLYTGVFSGSNLIPTTQPYAIGQNPASTYPGTESVGSFPATAVDWVLVHLRSTPNGNNVQTRAGILLQNGNIVDITAGFASPLNFSTTVPGSYYVVVNHRNHLGVMSAAPVALTSTPTVFDFTTGNATAYTGAGVDLNNAPMVQLAPGLFGLWGGDSNHDSQIYYYGPGSDAESISIDYLANDPDAGYNNTYEGGDINMDGQTYYYGPGSDPEYLSITALANDPDAGYLSEQVPVQVSPGGRMMMPVRRGRLVPVKK